MAEIEIRGLYELNATIEALKGMRTEWVAMKKEGTPEVHTDIFRDDGSEARIKVIVSDKLLEKRTHLK